MFVNRLFFILFRCFGKRSVIMPAVKKMNALIVFAFIGGLSCLRL